MALEGVPWAVGAWEVGGTQGVPETPAEAARGLAHLVIGGLEGPSGPGDMAVVPLDVPGAGVLVRKGTVGLLNRFPGGFGQAYVARNTGDEQVNLTATSSAGSRTDLIALVVEDPQYAGQPLPADGAHGPYVRFVVYEGVSANIKKLSEVAPNQTGIALARVTRPASTGTVQAAHITNLRVLPNPRSKTVKKQLTVGDKGTFDRLNAASWERFPQAAQWDIEVPSWATHVQLELRVNGVRVTNDGTDAGNFRGRARLKLGSYVSGEVIVDPEIPDANKGRKFPYATAGEALVAQADRGATLALEAQAYKVSDASGVEVREAAGTTLIAEVVFTEVPNSDPVESF